MYVSLLVSESQQWRWIDQWPLLTSNWAGNQPNITTGLCVAINQEGQFYSVPCSEQRPFACKAEFYDYVPDWDSTVDALGPTLMCDQGWTSIGLHCIKVFEEKLPYYEANGNCVGHGGYLASIHSPNYNEVIKGNVIFYFM